MSQKKLHPIDCDVLNEAVEAVSQNTLRTLAPSITKPLSKMRDTVFMIDRSLVPGTKLTVQIKNKRLFITSFLPEPTNYFTVKDFLQDRQLDIWNCRENVHSPVSYNAMYDDRMYEEMGNTTLSMYVDSAGYAVEIHPVLPLPKNCKMPMVNTVALAQVVRACEKQNYRNMVYKEAVESVPMIGNAGQYHWLGSRKKVFSGNNINHFMFKSYDSSDFAFTFVEQSTKYHPEVRKSKFPDWVSSVHKGLTAQGIRIREAYSDNGDYYLETLNCKLQFRYKHDIYDIKMANFILIAWPI